MAVSLLWSMFYSKIFSQKSDIAERLDTANVLIIFICTCILKVLYPLFYRLFPNYQENIHFYNVALQYAALIYFLPNTLIKYLGDKRTLISICCIILLHLCLVFSSNFFGKALELLPMISLFTYLCIEILGLRNNNKLLFSVRVLISILLAIVCIL